MLSLFFLNLFPLGITGALDAAADEAAVTKKGMDELVERLQAEILTSNTLLREEMTAVLSGKSTVEKDVRDLSESVRKLEADLSASESNLRTAIAREQQLVTTIQGFEDTLSKALGEASAATKGNTEAMTKIEALNASAAAALIKETELGKRAHAEADAARKAAGDANVANEQLASMEKEVINLTVKLSQSDAIIKDLKAQSKTWEEKSSELEKRLMAYENVAKENALLTTKVQALEHELVGVKGDLKQLQDTAGKKTTLLKEVCNNHSKDLDQSDHRLIFSVCMHTNTHAHTSFLDIYNPLHVCIRSPISTNGHMEKFVNIYDMHACQISYIH